MPGTRRSYAPNLKAKVAIEAIKGSKTAAQIAQTFSVHPNLMAFWKKQAIDHLPELFSAGNGRPQTDIEKGQPKNENVEDLVGLYALLNRIRLYSSASVIAAPRIFPVLLRRNTEARQFPLRI